MLARVTELASDQGSIVVFIARELKDEFDKEETGFQVNLAVDHRYAQDIVTGLAAGDDVIVEVEAWQLLGGKVPVQV